MVEVGLSHQLSGSRAHYSMLKTLDYQWKAFFSERAPVSPDQASEDLVGLGQRDHPKHRNYKLFTCSIGSFLGHLNLFFFEGRA